MLWDEQKKGKFVKALKDRALVKFSDEGYYLHQVIREIAIETIKLTSDWKKSHTEAGIFLSTLISNNFQSTITEFTFSNVTNSQEQIYINIEYAEKIVKHGLSKQETVALEIVYHALEFYGADCFEELMQEQKLSNNLFFQAVTSLIFDYIEKYKNLGITLYKYALSSYFIALYDEILDNVTLENNKNFKYSEKSFTASKSFFETALTIAERTKNNKLHSDILRSLASFYYFKGINLHQLGIYLVKTVKIREGKEAFDKSRDNLEKSFQIFTDIQARQETEEVKQAIDSLEISEKFFINS